MFAAFEESIKLVNIFTFVKVKMSDHPDDSIYTKELSKKYKKEKGKLNYSFATNNNLDNIEEVIYELKQGHIDEAILMTINLSTEEIAELLLYSDYAGIDLRYFATVLNSLKNRDAKNVRNLMNIYLLIDRNMKNEGSYDEKYANFANKLETYFHDSKEDKNVGHLVQRAAEKRSYSVLRFFQNNKNKFKYDNLDLVLGHIKGNDLEMVLKYFTKYSQEEKVTDEDITNILKIMLKYNTTMMIFFFIDIGIIKNNHIRSISQYHYAEKLNEIIEQYNNRKSLE